LIYYNSSPSFVIVAGPNGSGKSTYIAKFLSTTNNQHQTLNYDEIVKARKITDPISISAGKELYKRFNTYQQNLTSFIYETTLSDSSNFLLNKIIEMQSANWDVSLIYLWISSYKVSIRRVKQRVSMGGHSVDESFLKQRYKRSIRNIISNYLPVCINVMCLNNETKEVSTIFSKEDGKLTIHDESLYNVMSG